MSPPFGFLRNFTNHQPKAVVPVHQEDSKPTKLLKRKATARKTTSGHIPPESQLVDSFNDIIGAASQLDDISPSRYPAHPFAGINKTSSNHGAIANTGPISYRPDGFSSGVNEGFQVQRNVPSTPRSTPRSSPYESRQRLNHEPVSSTPPPALHVLERGEHVLRVDNSFTPPDETPVVSQYMAGGYRQPQVPPEELPPPSRSWSPIPSVHREPSRTTESYSPDREGIADQSWLENGNLGNRFSADVTGTDPRISTTAEIGRPDSRSIHTIHYVEYTDNPQPESIPREMSERREVAQNVRPNENTARRQPSQTRFQTPGPIEQEPIDPTVLQQEYWDDEDSDPEIYHYIVPAGLKVTFQDQAGNMITRVGKRGQVENASRSSTVSSVPIVVHDEFGNELFRSKHIRGSSPTPRELQQGHFRLNSRGQYGQQDDMFRGGDVFEMNGGRKGRQASPWRSHPSTMSSRSTKTIMIDEKGNQMLLKSPSIHRDGGRRLEQPYADISYHARISNI